LFWCKTKQYYISSQKRNQ